MIEANRAEGGKGGKGGTGAFRLAKDSLAPATLASSQSYHERLPGSAPLFFGEYATELPDLGMVRELSEEKGAYYAARHIGKRGRDLFTDTPIEGNDGRAGKLKTSPQLSTQGWGARSIRGYAATATIDQSKGAYIAQLHKHVVNAIGGGAGQVVHVIRPARDPYAEDSTLNFFTFCEQTELTSALNHLESAAARKEGRAPICFGDSKSLIALSRTSRTEASPIGRLVQQPYFSTSELRSGDKVIIADDHVEAGGSMLAMEAAARGAGADVLALAALSAHPFSPQLGMSDEIRGLLGQTLSVWDPEGRVTSRLSSMGLPSERLTNSEALTLIAYATDPTDVPAVTRFDALQTRFFERAQLHNLGIDPDSPDASKKLAELRTRQEAFGSAAARAFIENARVPEGAHDSLTPILRQAPKSPDEVLAELEHVSEATRKSVHATEVKNVYVLDWDDCLRDEKGLNYELMHNALAVSAGAFERDYPEIGRARDLLQSPEAGRQSPLLAMKKEAFSKHLIENPQIFKKHVVEDFVKQTMQEVDESRKKRIVNILFTEFTRQYKGLVRPGSAGERAKLPYPDVEFKLMPGALDFLKAHRKPDARVVLISNRTDGDLQDEVNHMGLMHYFDVVSGSPLLTTAKAKSEAVEMPEVLQSRLMYKLRDGTTEDLRHTLEEAAAFAHPDSTTVAPVDKKPHAQRLSDSIALLSVPADVSVFAVGDQPTDVTQIAKLRESVGSLSGLVVNPGLQEKVEAAREKSGIAIAHQASLQG